MGTRSITIVRNQNKNNILTMYKQYDGYPSGLGIELKDFIESGTIVNGIGMNDKNVFNGISCFAAQLVAHFKDGPGGIYLEHFINFNKPTKKVITDICNMFGTDYVYIIESDLSISCFDYNGAPCNITAEEEDE